MLLRELLGGFAKALLVARELLGQIGPQRVVRLGIVDEGDEALDHLVRLGGRLPVLRRDDGQADLALLVDVGMVDLGFERDFRRLERIFGREINFDAEGALVVRSVVGHDKALPA